MLQTILYLLAQGGVVNTTAYRVTPLNYSGSILNMDTADVYADCSFGIMELTMPYWCPENNYTTSCMNRPILNVPGYNVFESHIIEHDTRLGAYAPCNPNPDTGVFECVSSFPVVDPLTPMAPKCWYEVPEYKDTFAPFCSVKECGCDVLQKYAVGVEYSPGVDQGVTPVDGAPVCHPYFIQNGSKPIFGANPPPLEYVNTTLEGCCSHIPTGTTEIIFAYYDAKANTCTVGSNVTSFAVTDPSNSILASYMGGLKGNGHFYISALGDVANITNGTYYSTREEGRCKPGEVVGEDCWWKDHGVTRRVNATCLSQNLVRAVARRRPACWEQSCGGLPKPEDTSSWTGECSVRCLIASALGLQGVTPTQAPLAKHEICEGFFTSLEKIDPDELGCPEI